MLRMVITVFSWSKPDSNCCLWSSFQASSEKGEQKEQNLKDFFQKTQKQKNGTALFSPWGLFHVFIWGWFAVWDRKKKNVQLNNFLPTNSRRCDRGWYVNWCWPLFVSVSLNAYSSAVYPLQMKHGHLQEPATCWEKGSPAAQPSSCKTLLPLHYWVPRSTFNPPHDVRDAWLPNIEMDQKFPYVSMACISHKHSLASH